MHYKIPSRYNPFSLPLYAYHKGQFFIFAKLLIHDERYVIKKNLDSMLYRVVLFAKNTLTNSSILYRKKDRRILCYAKIFPRQIYD